MSELTTLRGIGEKTAAAFNRLGIFSAEDLIYYYPRDYERFNEPSPIYELCPGSTMAVEGVLNSDASVNRYNGRVIVNAYLSDMTGRLQLSWFNSPFLKNSLKAGRHLVFRGRISEKNGRLMMIQPKIYDADAYREKYAGRIMPVYPLSKGITNSTVMNAVAEALNRYGRAGEFLPERIRDELKLGSMDSSLIRLHFPRSEQELSAARERAVFNEFFMSMLAGSKLSDNARKSVSSHRCRPDMRMMKVMAGLPFELTKAQVRAYRDISSDMNSGHVMNRLVEGDVGSGKTIVALLSAIYASLNGYQSVIMAPTAVLARQHFDTLNSLLDSISANEDMGGAELGISTVLLTGGMGAAEKRTALKRIREHEADIIIGTHAVFQEKTEYHDLGLVVTDEQHRFGVGQREAIFNKGDIPHTLIMSATPIPRTLSLIVYSGMDVSILDARPTGRLPIKNCVVGPSYRKTAYRFIYDEIKKGRQAYIICPAIEDTSEDGTDKTAGLSELENVTDYAERLKRVFPPEVRIGILHGRMRDADKDRIMESFKERDIDLLISTTVVEVGVDVPNASVMMVENAERFGLAELHQLRGRVGRGKEQSYCIMINTSDSEKAAERLGILNASNDGFKIAEEDLKLRGPGDIFGFKQSGEASYRIADIYRDTDILKKARRAVYMLLKTDPELEEPEDLKLNKMLLKYMETGNIL